MTIKRTFCVAPMLDWTDRHCRFFLRQLSNHAVLYTEMVTTGALLHGPRDDLLAFDPAEQPLALQLGGSDPDELATCARIVEDRGYAEVNLNVGCPSDRVQSGRFGACLMAEPGLVAECLAAMAEAVEIPVTVKTRIGIDRQDSLDELSRFVEAVKQSGCRTFIIHARKAWLDGLSPKENRTVPPLHYDRVYAIKQAHPELEIIINGGIRTIEACHEHLQHVDGVMIGREACQNSYILSQVDREFYGSEAIPPSRQDVVNKLKPYIQKHLDAGGRLHHISRHILGLYLAEPGARLWRQILSRRSHLDGSGIAVIDEALDAVESARNLSRGQTL